MNVSYTMQFHTVLSGSHAFVYPQLQKLPQSKLVSISKAGVSIEWYDNQLIDNQHNQCILLSVH